MLGDIIISMTENGYLVEKQKPGYDWKNRWVAESIESLLKIIKELCEEEEEEGGKT